MNDPDRVGDILRSYAGSPEPSPTSFDKAEEALTDLLTGAEQAQDRSPRKHRALLLAGAAVAGLVVSILAIPPALQRSGLRATVDEVARAAEMVDPATVNEQEFLYLLSMGNNLVIRSAENLEGVQFDSEFLVALIYQTRETWYGGAGTVQIRALRERPMFFNPEAEDAYFSAGLDRVDQIGETVTETVHLPDPREVWPTDPDELRLFIASTAATGRDLPEAVERLEVALRIVRDVFASPQQRAAVLRLIGDLPGMEIAQTDSHLGLAIEYRNRGVLTRQVIEFDSEGFLERESMTILEDDQTLGIPAGTTVSSATYTRPVVVESLETP